VSTSTKTNPPVKSNKAGILPILILAYPILTHIAIGQNQFKLALFLLGIIAGLSLISRSKQQESYSNAYFQSALWIGMILFAACILVLDATRVTLYLPPILVISFITLNFARTLLPGEEPLITKIARVIFKDDGPEISAYTRRVTWLWTGFLSTILIQTILLSLFASIETWSLFTNVINYCFMGLLFIIEYIYRQIRFGYRHSIFYYLRGLAQFPVNQFFRK
jgi:uncharacterized membrane protein